MLEIAREYTINLKYGGAGTSTSSVVVKTPSGTSIRSHTGSKTSKSSRRSSTTSSKKQKLRAQQQVKSQLLKDFYEKAYRTLAILQQCIGHFKTIIFDLTFTKYSEDELTEPEAKMTRGKSIVGSCIWMLTYALQQLTDDPDVEQFEYTPKANSDITELAVEFQSLVYLSLQTWHELLLTIGVIERINKKTEEIFAKQTTIFATKSKPDSETANMANSHNKYRRAQGELHELRNFKGLDPYATLLTWSNKRQVSSRVLYITKYTDPDSLWLGFDPLPLDKKIPVLKDLLNFTRLVFESVKESIQKINTDLQGLARQDILTPNFRKQQPPPSSNRQPTNHFSGIMAYEDGIDVMDEILASKLAPIEWNAEEIHEFFETDKIFLDDMDLLTLGACVTRTILYEATHIVHICYETCRLLDYKEFLILPSYEKLYYRVRDDYVDSRIQNGKKGKRLSLFPPGPHSYDAEDTHLDLRNVAGLFRTSNYQEILKNLPVYTNRIGVTLQ